MLQTNVQRPITHLNWLGRFVDLTHTTNPTTLQIRVRRAALIHCLFRPGTYRSLPKYLAGGIKGRVPPFPHRGYDTVDRGSFLNPVYQRGEGVVPRIILKSRHRRSVPKAEVLEVPGLSGTTEHPRGIDCCCGWCKCIGGGCVPLRPYLHLGQPLLGFLEEVNTVSGGGTYAMLHSGHQEEPHEGVKIHA